MLTGIQLAKASTGLPLDRHSKVEHRLKVSLNYSVADSEISLRSHRCELQQNKAKKYVYLRNLIEHNEERAKQKLNLIFILLL